DRAVWAIAIGASGEVSASPRLVAQSDNHVDRPHIASNGVDYLVAWTDSTSSTEQGMALRLDRDGNAGGAPFPLSGRRNVASVGFTSYRPATATRIRRGGDAIETIEQDTLLTQPFSGVAAGATHAGAYFTISLSTLGVAPVSAPPSAERPLLTFAAPQNMPTI